MRSKGTEKRIGCSTAIFKDSRGKFLQLHVTIEDEGVFTTPWTATVTYMPGPDHIAEGVCAENPHEYYNNEDWDVRKPRNRTSEE
jgi:hypothetical protein